MVRLSAACLALLAVAACHPSEPERSRQSTIPKEDLRSGSDYLTPETLAQQEDDFENPGYLWVERGERLFSMASGAETPCSECHDDGLKGVSATYPKFDDTLGRLINLEARINLCRSEHQSLPALDYESEDLLAITAYVANQSRGMPLAVPLTEAARDNYERGKEYFYTRRGQFNLSCEQCHVENNGRKLRGDTISQGHPNGFPAYRFEWQTFGSLHRRLQDCDTGVRAEPFDLGSDTYLDLEYFLSVRANGLEIETPAIRR